MRLKVLSWNIWMNGDLEGVLKFGEESRADVIGCQEVVPAREPNVIAGMEALGYKAAFSAALDIQHDGRIMGNAIFSKYPIKSEQTHVLSEFDSAGFESAEFERRIAVQVDIDCSDSLISVFTTHLAHSHQKPSPKQEAQAEKLVRLVPRERAIVMGDFNAIPESNTIRIMKRVFIDTDLAGTPTWSMYPEGCDVCNPQSVDIRLDYMFTTPDLKVLSSRVENSNASDHLPISAEIEV